jgi:hypothetical protein
MGAARFRALHIDDFDDHGTPNLPPTLDRHDPFAASLFQSSLQIQLKNVVIVRIRKGLSRRQGLDMAVVYAKYRSAERTIAGYLILSDLTLKNKLYRCICIRIDQYNWLHISNHDDFNALV